MDKFNKALYRGLKFFANNRLGRINYLRERRFSDYRRNVKGFVERYSYEQGYIDVDSRNMYAIGGEGLHQLRMLTDIVYKEWTTWVLTGTLVISVITLAINLILKIGGQ